MSKLPPKPQKDVIYVDVDDEITSIIDKVESAENKVVALVLPKRAASLQSTVNMKLLKRSADSADKNVVLITSEQALMPLAGAAKLHVAKNLQSAPEIPEAPTAAKPAADNPALDNDDATEEDLPKKIDYGLPIGALAAKHESENPETIDLDDGEEEKPAAAKPSKREKVKVPNFDRFRMLLGLGGLGLLALVAFIIAAIFILPKATITVHTASEPVTANFNVKASEDAALDPQAGTMPAKLQKTEQTATQQVTATGQQNNGDKASGSVSMSAQKCSGNPFIPPDDVPAGTGVSSGGNTYITRENTSFHGTGTSGSCYTYEANSSTSITAQSGGAKYNVSSANFTVSGRSDVTASGSASGGTDNIVNVLSQGDVDGVKQKLTSGANSDQFAKDFEKKLSDQGEYVLTSTLKTGDPALTSTPSVGQPASTANVTIKISYSVLTVKKDDLKQIIQAELADKIDKAKQKLSGNFLDDANISVESQSAPNSVTLAINEDTTAVPIINVQGVKKQSEGKKAGDIKSSIGNWPGVKSVDVKLSPFWVSKVPKKDSKVKVILQEVKADNSGGP